MRLAQRCIMVILHLNRYSIWRAPVAGAAAVSAAIWHCLGIGLRLFASLSSFLLLLLRCASCSCRSRCVLCGRGRLGCGACTYSLLPGSEPDGVGGLPHVRARERDDTAAAGGRGGVDRLRGPRDRRCWSAGTCPLSGLRRLTAGRRPEPHLSFCTLPAARQSVTITAEHLQAPALSAKAEGRRASCIHSAAAAAAMVLVVAIPASAGGVGGEGGAVVVGSSVPNEHCI